MQVMLSKSKKVIASNFISLTQKANSNCEIKVMLLGGTSHEMVVFQAKYVTSSMAEKKARSCKTSTTRESVVLVFKGTWNFILQILLLKRNVKLLVSQLICI